MVQNGWQHKCSYRFNCYLDENIFKKFLACFGPSAPDYKVDARFLDVPDDEDIVVNDDSTATKN